LIVVHDRGLVLVLGVFHDTRDLLRCLNLVLRINEINIIAKSQMENLGRAVYWIIITYTDHQRLLEILRRNQLNVAVFVIMDMHPHDATKLGFRAS
jgi:hypothetical protein